MKVKITQIVTVDMTEEEYEMLLEACFEDGDRQMLHETINDEEDELLIEKVEK